MRLLWLLLLASTAQADQLRAQFRWDEPLSHPVYAEPFTELVLYIDSERLDDGFFPVFGSLDYTSAKSRYPVPISGACTPHGSGFFCTLYSDVYGIRFMYRSLYSTLQVNRPNDQTRIAELVSAVIVQNAERVSQP